jgi:hypothetical protein
MKKGASVCFLALVGVLVASGNSGATPTGGSCPVSTSGFVVWDVNTEPYQVDNAVDANGDGIVCAKPVDSLTFVSGGQTYQVYNFIDDVIRS